MNLLIFGVVCYTLYTMPGPKKEKLDAVDHSILDLLIKGYEVKEVGVEIKMANTAVARRLNRMRSLLQVKTTYQLIALEVVNLLNLPDEMI